MGKQKIEDNFFNRVYAVVRLIPYGRVTSYGAIAHAIGSPLASKMVGWAMNNSHALHDVPAHRVVNRNGLLTGKNHFAGENMMQQLLESEGIYVKENKVVDFEKIFWNPQNEIMIDDE
ncbi:MAG: MGMT family protein [Bacteroidales bacterium]|nr:MGMT family protein [Bacteroidales bacterium]